MKPVFWYEYEEACGLLRGQLWERLSEEERNELKRRGYRPRSKLPNGAYDYLKSVFPLPDHQTELVSITKYEKNCGFSKGELINLLTEEQLENLQNLGYRPKKRLTYRAILYLKSLGFY